MVLSDADDLSGFKERYNSFEVITDDFTSKEGEYTYAVYEQDNDTNTDPGNVIGLLETGILIVEKANGFSFTSHSSNNTYTVR